MCRGVTLHACKLCGICILTRSEFCEESIGGNESMKEILTLELLGSAQLIAGKILVRLGSFYSSEWWSVVSGFLAVFFD